MTSLSTPTGYRLDVMKHSKYSTVDLDLWRTSFNLSEQGREAMLELLRDAAKEFCARGGRKPFFCAGGKTSAYAKVFPDQAEQLATDIRRLVDTPGMTVPLRPIGAEDSPKLRGAR